MPDPQLGSDSVTTLGKAGGVIALLFGLVRVFVYGWKKIGNIELLSQADTQRVLALYAEIETLTKRIDMLANQNDAAEDATRRAQDEAILYKRRLVETSSELAVVKAELERCLEAWDPDRTLPPRLG